ncbi:isxo2-like transposase domain [Holotrichia oblita]|uniref:Isxo2-like transposase domain n=1 Tax=Holotrichia oblita TaxID=644536 RepID=A0ACB9SKD0_HOLOL|nr:isxo2-like transposase domain [Holotrichia oblita]
MASISTAAPAPPVKVINVLRLGEIVRNIEELHLQRWGLIPVESAYKCPACRNSLTLQRMENRTDGWVWQCNHKVSVRKQKSKKCATRVEFRTGTFFARSKLSLHQILGFVNYWVNWASLTLISGQLEFSLHTAVDWASFCREVCLEHYMRRPNKLGDPGIVVEIDESKFGRRKYNKGHRIEGQWVFGGFERGTGWIFMVPVEQRDTDTLLPIIKDWIEPGTTIISDYWKAYDVLRHERYEHLKVSFYGNLYSLFLYCVPVNHSITFKDPETGARTNSIESSWRVAKASMTSSGRIKAHIPGNLARFMFLNRCRVLHLEPTLEFFRMAGELYNPEAGREDLEEDWSDDGKEELFLDPDLLNKYITDNTNSTSLECEEKKDETHYIQLLVPLNTTFIVYVRNVTQQYSPIRQPPVTANIKVRLAQAGSGLFRAERSTEHDDVSSDQWECKCSCKAGADGYCKHVIATLFYVNKFEDIDIYSSTDMQQAWGKQKKIVNKLYTTSKITTFCHGKRKEKSMKMKPTEQLDKINLNVLINSIDHKTTTYKHKIETEVLNNVFFDSIAINIKNYNLSDCCLNVIHQLELAEIISDCPQRSPEWKNIRQLRITGSRCYSLYTFKGDWIKKAENYFWPKEFSSIYTSHGNFFEKHALAAYKNITQCDIWVPNFVIAKLFPWLGVSPDGVSFVHGQPTQLLEIKCPYPGKDLSAHGFMDGCSYINVSDTGELVLKENHQYYAQVQLGMAILNLKSS